MNDRLRTLVRAGGLALLACALIAGTWKWTQSRRNGPADRQPAGREILRSELDLRDGVLFAKGESRPFNGLLVENFAPGRRKLEIEIWNGKAHGRSRGWHRNGQLEVEELFVDGVSHGPRTRWHPNGSRRSSAQVQRGELVGRFTEWHDNGQRAAEMTLSHGQPDGLAEAWHRSGALKSRSQFARGQLVSQRFWDDPPSPAPIVERHAAPDLGKPLSVEVTASGISHAPK